MWLSVFRAPVFELKNCDGVVKFVEFYIFDQVPFCFDESGERFIRLASVINYSAGAEVNYAAYVAFAVLLVEDGSAFMHGFLEKFGVAYLRD